MWQCFQGCIRDLCWLCIASCLLSALRSVLILHFVFLGTVLRPLRFHFCRNARTMSIFIFIYFSPSSFFLNLFLIASCNVYYLVCWLVYVLLLYSIRLDFQDIALLSNILTAYTVQYYLSVSEFVTQSLISPLHHRMNNQHGHGMCWVPMDWTTTTAVLGTSGST